MTETARRFRPAVLASSISLFLAGVTVPGRGADLEKFTPHHVAKLRAVASAAISPDGSKVAYVLAVPRKPGVEEDGPSWAELHVVGPDGKSRPYVTGEVNVAEPTWTRDGNALLFLAKRGKDEHKSLYKIDADGGEARRVVAFGSDIASFAVKADGRRVAFLAAEPDSKAKLDQKKKGFSQILHEEELKPTRLWLATVDDPSPPKLVKLPGSASELRSNPVGEQLALALAPTPTVDDNFTRRRVHVTLAGPAGLVRFENPGKLGKVAFSPDGKYVAMIAAEDEHDPAAGRLVVGSVETGQMKDILPGYPGHVADVAWSDPDTVAFVGDEGTGTVIGTVEVDGSGLSTTPTGDIVVTSFSVAWNGRTAALVGQSPRHPGEVFRTEIGQGARPARLTDSNSWLAGMEFAPQEVVSYKARDGLELQGVLIRPIGVAPGTLVPLVLDVHGGPEAHVRNGWITSYSMPGQVLAGKGTAVFLPNYRGSTGRGVAFSKLGQGDPAGKEFDDLVDAVDHLIEVGLADRSKVGITGGSYGGYATAWCSTRHSDRFAAGVMFVGISDKISKMGTTDIPDEEYLVHARRRPWDDWQALLERSPIYHADKSRTPLLILHGKEDPRVFPGQSLELYRFLKIRGQAPVRLVLYPGEGHGNLRAASRLDYNLRMFAWLTHYLQDPGGPMPPADLEYDEPRSKSPEKP
jgi:dipeptidyl aminopeptidase/acylaminoacyl peptidase